MCCDSAKCHGKGAPVYAKIYWSWKNIDLGETIRELCKECYDACTPWTCGCESNDCMDVREEIMHES